MKGVILLAYVVAIPANEIVIPTVLIYTALITEANELGAGAGVMFELEQQADLMALFTAGGWTMVTAVNLMLFSLIHNPCSTTLYTIRPGDQKRQVDYSGRAAAAGDGIVGSARGRASLAVVGVENSRLPP